MIEKKVTIPAPLLHPVLFADDYVVWQREDELTLSVKEPFIYEAAYFSGLESLKPWEIGEVAISALLVEWTGVKEEIETQFAKRDRKGALPFMRKGLGLFLQFLHWANGKPTRIKPEIEYDQLEIKPVNLKERVEFILARPNLYHSSKQLIELMDELEKGYKKAVAIKKINKSV